MTIEQKNNVKLTYEPHGAGKVMWYAVYVDDKCVFSHLNVVEAGKAFRYWAR